jgi:hypothetical protein
MDQNDTRPICQYNIGMGDVTVDCGYMLPQGIFAQIPIAAHRTGKFIAGFEVVASQKNGPLSRISKIPWVGGMFYRCWQLLNAGRT